MRLRKAIKKIVALGTGTTMIGATLLGATAADLSDYPSPFVKDGVFNGKIVVGAEAAAQDVIGSIEIATSLQTESVIETAVSVGGSSATTTLIGDSYKVEKSSDKVNLQEALDPVESITDKELDALADGSISNEHGDFDYEQVLSDFSTASVLYVEDDDQSDDPDLYLWFPSGSNVYSYRLSFPSAIESDVDTDKDFDDLDNKKLKLLGNDYTIISTDNTTGKISLMGGAIQDTLQEYEKKTYTLDGVPYEVEVVAISSGSQVIMKINGEVTEKKDEGETVKLSDGTEVGIKTILENEGTETGGGDLVTFYLGASKVVLQDNNWSAGNTDGELEVGSDTMSDVYVDIVGSRAANKVSISKIEIVWPAGEDYYVPIGGKLSERLETDEKGFLFLQNLDFEFAAFQDNHNDEITVKAQGDDEYTLTVSTAEGANAYSVFYTTGGEVALGEASNPIDTDLQAMAEDTRFFLTKNKDSYFMEVTKVEDDKVTFENLVTGQPSEASVTGNAGTLLLAGSEFDFVTNPTDTWVNMSDLGDFLGLAKFYTDDEFIVHLYTANATGYTSNSTPSATTTEYGWINITEYEKDDDNTQDVISTSISPKTASADMGVTVTVGVTNNTAVWEGFHTWESKDNFKTAYTTYGTYMEWDTDDQDTLTFHTGDEAFAEVFISSGVTSVSKAGEVSEGSVTTTTVNEIEVGSAVLDTEVADVTADNYISVGGPCANSVSARLVGVAQKIPECLSGLSLAEGEGVVKLFENGEYVSMLVAGATALDSQRAARVVAKYGSYPDTFTGMEVSVTGTSLSDITVSAPTPAAPADDMDATTDDTDTE
jgi:hypothetical protein